jgi:hypothetical protein
MMSMFYHGKDRQVILIKRKSRVVGLFMARMLNALAHNNAVTRRARISADTGKVC